MLKIKNNKIRGSTADLIIAHSRAHLVRRPHLLVRETLPSFSKTISPLIFAFAGLVVIAAAVQIVASSNIESATFVSQKTTDYVAQQNFYTGGSSENLHAAADFTAVREKVHQAAVATELSYILNLLGLVLVFVALFYLHREHDIFKTGKVKFRVRRIR